jgi:proline utilization trans-activator
LFAIPANSLLTFNLRIADSLVEAFFEHVHGDFVVFHRSSFLGRYEALWAPSLEPRRTDDYEAWICCVAMVMIIGGTWIQSRPESVPPFIRLDQLIETQRAFMTRVHTLLPRVLCGTALVNIQAALLVSLHLHNNNERSAAWNLTGAAIRMAFAIGLHRKEHIGRAMGGSLEREVRKRVFWTLYLYERFLCSSLGRPSAIDDDDVDLDLPRESLLEVGEHIPLGHLGEEVALFRIMGRICKTIYHPIRHPTSQTDVAQSILDELDAWYSALPPHLALGSAIPPTHRRAVTLLHIKYQAAIALLTRPFLLLRSTGKRLTEDGTSTTAFARRSIQSAQASTALLSDLDRNSLYNSSTALDVFYTYSSIMILAVPLIWNQNQSTSSPGVLPEENQDDVRESVKRGLDVIKDSRLAPTMARFAEVTHNLARAVGLADLEPEPSAASAVAASNGATAASTATSAAAAAMTPNGHGGGGGSSSIGLSNIQPTMTFDPLSSFAGASVISSLGLGFGTPISATDLFSTANTGATPGSDTSINTWDMAMGWNWDDLSSLLLHTDQSNANNANTPSGQGGGGGASTHSAAPADVDLNGTNTPGSGGPS